MRKITFFALLALSFLVACGAPPPAAPSPILPSKPVPTSTQAPTPLPTNTESPLPEHRIGVRLVDGVAEFYDRQTGDKFIPRGNSYSHIGLLASPCLDTGVVYHTLFNIGVYDSARVEAALSEMQRQGYNTVRVFYNDGCMSDAGKNLRPEYVRNLADTIQRAGDHGIYVILTSDDLSVDVPWRADIIWPNLRYMSSVDIQAEGRRWQELIRSLAEAGAPTGAFLAYELQSEAAYLADVLPLSRSTGWVTTGNGKSYDLSDPLDREAMMDDNLVAWIDGLRAAIREVDPTALVTVGFPAPPAGDPRLARPRAALTRSTADFIDVHFYAGAGESLPEFMQRYDLNGLAQKPIFLGEFGAPTGWYPIAAEAGRVLQDWQIEACRLGLDGYLLWTWDQSEDPNFWTAQDQDGAVGRWLSPVIRPDPCAAGTQIEVAVESSGGKLIVQGRAHDAAGQPLANASLAYRVIPLDGPGVYGVYTFSGIVPPGADQGDVGLRLNTECNCRGNASLFLYSGRFIQGAGGENRTPNPRFASGMDGWGPWGSGRVKLQLSDRGGYGLDISVGPDQDVGLNSGNFPVTPGEPFTATFEARIAPGSESSGYLDIVFLNGSQEVKRFLIELAAAAFSSGQLTTGDGGDFTLDLADLPAGKWQIVVSYSGDDLRLPGEGEVTINENP